MLPTSQTKDGRFAANVLNFARVLRAAGLPLGTDRPLLALRALEVAGIRSRADLHASLRACLIDRQEHRALFDEAFQLFWRDPDDLREVLGLLLPPAGASAGTAPVPRRSSRRLTEALISDHARTRAASAAERLTVEARESWSDRERLRKTDFDSMTTAEWAAARHLVAELEPLFARLSTRRDAPASHGRRIDLRQLLRDCARHGGDIATLPHRQRRTRIEPLVVLVDISGSMSRYSRIFLHFLHALENGSRATGRRVEAFVFATRLTHVTHQLRARDPDEAIGRVVQHVADWSGGTRIAQCLKEFNRRWSRRVPLSSATVLLATDGLEHADLELLSIQCARLARSCRRLLWLNPLLRYRDFEPKARGIRAMLPHVDQLLSMHNIDSLAELTQVLSGAYRPDRPFGHPKATVSPLPADHTSAA